MRARRKSVADGELLIVPTFNAPASVVFALWSRPEHLKRWMGPKDFTCPEASIDFRVGGSYRAMLKSDMQGENWFSGVYREIVPDKRLVFTFTWENEGPSAGSKWWCGWSQAFDKQAAYAEKIAKEHPG
jgi:uncharacterized protein YndB with AHSA1/START domain